MLQDTLQQKKFTNSKQGRRQAGAASAWSAAAATGTGSAAAAHPLGPSSRPAAAPGHQARERAPRATGGSRAEPRACGVGPATGWRWQTRARSPARWHAARTLQHPHSERKSWTGCYARRRPPRSLCFSASDATRWLSASLLFQSSRSRLPPPLCL